jgi:hypothetical protein
MPCIHGANPRQCEICDAEKEVERLQARVKELEDREWITALFDMDNAEQVQSEAERLQVELDETIRSHQKQNATVARFEAMFCDKHLDAVPLYTWKDQLCAQCLADRLQAEVERLTGEEESTGGAWVAIQNLNAILTQQLADQRAEVERLQRLAVHCPDCGADYAATGIEAGCPCKLRAVMDGLEADRDFWQKQAEIQAGSLRTVMVEIERHKVRKENADDICMCEYLRQEERKGFEAKIEGLKAEVGRLKSEAQTCKVGVANDSQRIVIEETM